MFRKITFSLIAALLLASHSLAADPPPWPKWLTPDEAYDMVSDKYDDNENVYFLDVRTPAEYIWIGHAGKDTPPVYWDKVVNIPVKKLTLVTDEFGVQNYDTFFLSYLHGGC